MSDDVTSVDALDTPIERATIDRLPLIVLDSWLETVRARRLLVVQKLQATRRAKRVAQISDIVLKYNKQYERSKAQLAKLDEQLEKIEASVDKLRAMELELEDHELEQVEEVE